LIPLLMTIESGADGSAIGDGGRAIGVLQIHPVVIYDVNRILTKSEYTLANRKNQSKSKEICRIYLLHYGRGAIQNDMPLSECLVILGRIWNGGPKGYKKTSTLPYARKIRQQIEFSSLAPD